ncbi:hypothetical protein ULF88_19620 [Halopseudomonas pachastrellae]|nr:hypothetical protein [Halopseudomonas pachastrellae]
MTRLPACCVASAMRPCAFALQLVRDGEVDGCLSAGNTGALMVLARSVLGTLDGVRRPAIMAPCQCPASFAMCWIWAPMSIARRAAV